MQTIIAQQLQLCGVQKEHRVLVGVSGGMDSVALLHALCALREQHVIADVAAAHLHHGIRGTDADADMAFVSALCAAMHVRLETARTDVPALAKRTGKTLEEAARDARYAFLREAKETLHAHWITLAHHAGDQAETVLMHLLRGSGLNGLCGMQPVRDDIIRPLLTVSHGTIADYIAQHDLNYCSDITNEDLHYTRNRVRHQLLPLLKEFNPAIEENLCRMAQRLSDDEAYITAQAQTVLKSACDAEGVSCPILAAAERPVQIRVFRILLAQHHVRDVSENLLNRLCGLLTARTGARARISDELSAWVSYSRLYIGRPAEYAEYCIPFNISGITQTPDGYFSAAQTDRWRTDEGVNVAYLDLDSLPDKLEIRTRQNGDRFFPLGASGTRKLKAYLIDRKVSREKRNVPMLCSDHTVLFIPGATISHTVRVTEMTQRILRVEYHENTFE